MTIILKGNPLSTNHIWKTSSARGFQTTYMTKDGKNLKESYQWQAKSQFKGNPSQNAILLEIRLYFGDKRKRDIDNYHKLSLDALSGIVYEDDSQIQRMVVEKFYDKENPRIEIDVVTE
jgi:crossover junction endodeoxyribonuclease RusA